MSKKLMPSPDYSPVFNRLIELSQKQGESISNLLDEFSSSRSAITAWKNGNINLDIIPKIAKRYKVSIEYILTGESGESAALPSEERSLLESYRKVNETSKLLISERARALAELEEAQAAKSTLKIKAVEEPQDDEEEEPLYLDMYDMPVSAGRGACIDYAKAETIQVPRTYETEQANYMVRISGDSMEPRFEDGDVVLVETTTELPQGGIGIFILNDEAYIKQLGDGCLISLNSKYAPIMINEYDTCLLKGRVIGVLEMKK